MDDSENILKQLLDELGPDSKPHSQSLGKYSLYQELTQAATQSRQNYKIKRKKALQQWTVPLESDDIEIPDKKNVATINIAIVRDEHTGMLRCQQEERRIDSSFPVLSPKELAERKKNNSAKHVFNSSCRAIEKGFSITDNTRDEVLSLLDNALLKPDELSEPRDNQHSPNSISCLSFIEAWTRYFLRDWFEEQKQQGTNKSNAKKQAQHDWINNVRNTLVDYGFNGAVKQMITIFRKLIQCFDKKLNIAITNAVLQRALIKQPKAKT